MSARKPAGDQGDAHTHGAVDWFKVLDVAVWVAVVVVVVIGAEMLVGKVVRERIARDAGRYLAKVSAGKPDDAA